MIYDGGVGVRVFILGQGGEEVGREREGGGEWCFEWYHKQKQQ